MDLKQLKEYCNDNIDLILDDLNVRYADRGEYLNGCCPIHHGDNSTAFSWSKDLGVFSCFTNGCHTQYGKDIIGLIKGVKNCNMNVAIEYLKDLLDIDDDKIQTHHVEREEDIFIRKIRNKNSVINSIILEDLDTIPDDLRNRRYLDLKTCNKYNLGISPSGWQNLKESRFVIPIYNDTNKLCGWTARTLNSESQPKYLNSKAFKKQLNLFNLNNAKQRIKETSCIILCEGPIDTIRMAQAGVGNAVGLMGCSISKEQVKLLIKHGALTLVTLLDKDKAGIEGAKIIEERLNDMFKCKDLTVALPTNDIGEMTNEELGEFVNRFLKEYT